MLDEDHFVAGNPRARKDEPIDVGLVNARLLALENEYFEQPSDSVMRKVRPGDFVKVCRHGERFWLKVTGYVGRKYHGQVANDLTRNSDLEFGDAIYFERKHIYDVLAD
jgi:hypothetical protein